MEQRKDRILERRVQVRHPVTVTNEALAIARRNIESTDWGRTRFAEIKAEVEHVVAQADDYVERMLPLLTPTNPYGFTCPNCVGTKSQEGAGYWMIQWDYKNPDVIRCRECGQTLPDPKYPETGVLTCPRAGQVIHYYLNPQERTHPADRTGKYAWQWVWKPAHPSFSGIVRERKIRFMLTACRNLALFYRFTGDARYAAKAVQILTRFSDCVRTWLYHDFYDTVADCDPLYAAWHDLNLPLVWKRNPSGRAYANSTYETGPVDDQPDKAKMLATYFGCGRIDPNAEYGVLTGICQAYDLVHDAVGDDHQSLWNARLRTKVERDLILEFLIGAEPFIGGPGRARNLCNKAPYVYAAMAMAAQCLGFVDYAHVALLGYEALRDHSFRDDGFSDESPIYTDMFLATMLWVPEWLHGFRWPKDYRKRSGIVDVYGTDAKLRRMMQTAVDQLRADGRCIPLSDTPAASPPTRQVFEIGLTRYPEYFAGTMPTIYRAQAGYRDEYAASGKKRKGTRNLLNVRPTEYALFHHSPAESNRDTGLRLPEAFFPVWMTAILRHGSMSEATVLALALNPPGNHRHSDNLTLYYWDRGQTILGEQGYVCDTPQLEWAHATASHNLVVVDDAEQLFWGEKSWPPNPLPTRQPSLRLMATSPVASVVEAESRAYEQCSEYRRLVALIKGPGAETFAVDIFRVHGGRKHAFRLFSEIAASDSGPGGREFAGLALPPEAPFPEFGRSIAPEHVFGLRDVRTANNPPDSWQATWRQRSRSYRLWMLSPSDRVEASNGPGQEALSQTGRRVRYLDVIREGSDLRSAFVAIHEPSGHHQSMPIIEAVRLDLPQKAGPDAVALRIRSKWGTYLVLSEFDEETEVDGVSFQGTFGIYCRQPQRGQWLFTCGATTLSSRGFGFAGASALWSGKIVRLTENTIVTDTDCPKNWPGAVTGTTGYVLTGQKQRRTGFAVANVAKRKIGVQRFPLPRATRFLLPATQMMYGQ